MGITIRHEREEDYFEVENMTREAFWDLYKPGCVEHLLVRQLRKAKAFLPELDYVAVDGDTIVGNIIYTKAIIESESGQATVLCMGPLTVLPSQQRKGIGSSLLRHTVEKAKEIGYLAIVIFGNPAYYHRFGFRDAREYRIQTSDGSNVDAFMVLDLSDNGLTGISGRFFEDAAFQIDEKDLDEYDKRFPYKEKHKGDSAWPG
jgi:predicted N-acetyltransferase YhbS